MRFTCAVLLCFVITMQGVAQSPDYYATNPADLEEAISAAMPGETIVMANGTWKDLSIQFDSEGAPGDTITLRAETAGEVRLTGSSSLRIGGSYLKVDGLYFTEGGLTGGHVVQFRRNTSTPAHHSRLTNTAIVDYNPQYDFTEYKWVSIYGTHNRVDNSHFEGKTHDGATLVVWLSDEPNYHKIDNNYFGPRPDLGKNGGETIRVGTSDWSLYPSHTIVERNLFDRCDGEIEIISNKSGDNTYRYNTFLESAGSLTLRHGDRARVDGNFFIGNGKANTGGVRIIGEDHVVVNNYFEGLRGSGYRTPISIVNGVPDSPLNRYFQVRRALVAHNTIVNSYSAFEIGSGSSSEQSLPPEDVAIANNIVSNVERPRINMVVEDDEPIRLTWSANIMWGTTLGISQPEGIELVDPLLQEGDDGQWRPAEASPAVGAADLEYSPVEDDVEGRTRPASPRTIGAHEIDVGAPPRRPLEKSDVGVTFSVNTHVETGHANTSGIELTGYPNPFRSRTTVSVTVDRPGKVRLDVYDILGRRVATLLDAVLNEGESRIRFEPNGLIAGLYLLSARAEGRRVVHPIIYQP